MSTAPISIEVDCGENCKGQKHQTRGGMAMIAPTHKYNFISRDFAELFFADAKSTELELATTYRVEDTLGGSINVTKEVNARWYCTKVPTTGKLVVRTAPKMVSSKFYIPEKPIDFDVIIGLEDIIKFDLSGLQLSLSKPSSHRDGNGTFRKNASC
jgi:hypothetical protein